MTYRRASRSSVSGGFRNEHENLRQRSSHARADSSRIPRSWFEIHWWRKVKAVDIKVAPDICASPCTIRVMMTINPHPDNYRLVLMWSDVYEPYGRGRGGSKAFDLKQESSNEFLYEIEGLPKGGYYFVASVYRGRKGTPFADSEGWAYVDMEPPK